MYVYEMHCTMYGCTMHNARRTLKLVPIIAATEAAAAAAALAQRCHIFMDGFQWHLMPFRTLYGNHLMHRKSYPHYERNCGIMYYTWHCAFFVCVCAMQQQITYSLVPDEIVFAP